VLVVDDEPLIGQAVRRSLQREHEVLPLSSAREALDMLLRGEPFDVILCDLMMPELSGMELYEEVSRRAPELARRFVFLTGGAFTPRARAFLERVSAPRLEKPFSPHEFRELVRRMLAGEPSPAATQPQSA
jgi:CheY-like chemotaxis protein